MRLGLRKLAIGSTLALCLSVAGLGVLRLTPLWDRLLTAGPLVPVRFATLVPPSTANWYLVCPPGHCPLAAPHRDSPVFPLSVDQLQARIDALLAADRSVTMIERRGPTIELVARTQVMHWPDRVTLEAIPVGDGGAMLAIYSRSIYGRRDMGANRDRVEAWLQRLQSSPVDGAPTDR